MEGVGHGLGKTVVLIGGTRGTQRPGCSDSTWGDLKTKLAGK